MEYITIIEISPTSIEMKIYESFDLKFYCIERVVEELGIFSLDKGKYIARYDMVGRLCDTLWSMVLISHSYGVYNIELVTTSSFNNLKNKTFLYDQIVTKTGLEVEIPSFLYKKRLLFKKYLKHRGSFDKDIRNTLVLNIGTSTTDLVFLRNNKLTRSETLTIGGYKIGELIESKNLTTADTLEFIRDYIDNYLREIKNELGRKKIKQLIVIGEIKREFLGSIEEKGKTSVLKTSSARLKETLELKKKDSFRNICDTYNISMVSAIKYFVESVVSYIVTDYFDIDDIYFLTYDTKDIMAYEFFYPKKKLALDREIDNLAMYAVRDLGKKYNYQKEHSEYTLEIIKGIFIILEEQNLVEKRYLRYLEIACYLHDIGKYIGFGSHENHSSYIVDHSMIFGLTEGDLEIVSLLCKAHNNKEVHEKELLLKVSRSEVMNIMKSIAILKIGVSLDRSKRQKAVKVIPILNREGLTIEVYTRESFLIEKVFFLKQVDFFKGTFGIDISLSIHRRYLGEKI